MRQKIQAQFYVGDARKLAINHFRVHEISRGRGHSLVRQAAYDAREDITDARTRKNHDWSWKLDLLSSEVLLPAGAPEWLSNLKALANEVERVEIRKDAHLARALEVALPHELTLAQNRELIRAYVQQQFVDQGYAAHIAIHAAPEEGDSRNMHAHVLVTSRKIDERGFAKTKSEGQDRYRSRRDFVEGLRVDWTETANRALRMAGREDAANLDHRSYRRRGIDWLAERHLGPVVTAIKRRLGYARVRRHALDPADAETENPKGKAFRRDEDDNGAGRKLAWWNAKLRHAVQAGENRWTQLGAIRRALHRSGIWPDLETARWETAEQIANSRVRHWSFQLETATNRRAAEERTVPAVQDRKIGRRPEIKLAPCPDMGIEREWDHDRSLTVSRRMTVSR